MSEWKDRPDDCITQQEAAEMIGRSIHSIRRWRKKHGLRVFREPGNATAPALVSKRELLAMAGKITEQHPGSTTSKQDPNHLASVTALGAQQGHIDSLKAQVADLMQGRADLQSLVDILTQRVDALQDQLRERAGRIAALETELNKGVRGLLKAGRRFLGV